MHGMALVLEHKPVPDKHELVDMQSVRPIFVEMKAEDRVEDQYIEAEVQTEDEECCSSQTDWGKVALGGVFSALATMWILSKTVKRTVCAA